jgi:hypothetical protein
VSVRETEDGELTTQRRIVGKCGVTADSTQTSGTNDRGLIALRTALINGAMPGSGVIGRKQATCQTDTGPSTDA